MTTNGSLPPSSSTVFFSASPAIAATDCPAGLLPVSVAAATAVVAQDRARPRSQPMSSVWKTSSGKPARRNRSSM